MIVCTFGENVVKFQVKSEKEELDRRVVDRSDKLVFCLIKLSPFVSTASDRSIDFKSTIFPPREKRGNKREGTLFLELKGEVEHA